MKTTACLFVADDVRRLTINNRSQAGFLVRAPAPDQHRRRAFTLIELLTAITILALLATLLFPALARAKASARRISCLNNLKQLQLAWLSYAHENNDTLPPNRAERDELDL